MGAVEEMEGVKSNLVETQIAKGNWPPHTPEPPSVASRPCGRFVPMHYTFLKKSLRHGLF